MEMETSRSKSLAFALLAVLALAGLSGCAGHFAMASRLNGIHVGMTKGEVIAILGEPASTAVTSGSEDLIYVLNTSAWDTRMPEPYTVRLTDGKVQSYGATADPAEELRYSEEDDSGARAALIYAIGNMNRPQPMPLMPFQQPRQPFIPLQPYSPVYVQPNQFVPNQYRNVFGN